MKALGGSYLKFVMCKQRDKERDIWCSREIYLIRQNKGFFQHQKGFKYGFQLGKFIGPVAAASSSAQTNVESEEEIKTICSDDPKTIHVRFKLHKECLFGQRLLIVGDDPNVGLWDPLDGVLLDWTDGHVWTAEMDIPSGKMIKYKFILKEETGTISWQPGPDRILETWETEKTITVVEDWDNPELQLVFEEELMADLNEENSNQIHVEESSSSDLLDVINELGNVNGHMNMVAENITEESGERDSIFSDKGSGSCLMSVTDQKDEETVSGNGGRMVNGSSLSSWRDEMRLVLDEGVPVLVPGLIPTPPKEMEVAELNLVENNRTIGFDEIEDSTKPELDEDKHVFVSKHSTETRETMIDEKPQLFGIENEIVENDMQWGRRTLQKFLANFGFRWHYR